MNFQRITQEPLRAVEAIRRDSSGSSSPIGRRTVDHRETSRRLHELAGHVAAGRLPLDDTSAPAVAEAMQRQYNRAVRGRRG